MPHSFDLVGDACCGSAAAYPFDEGFAINGATPHFQPSHRIVPTHYDITINCPHPERGEMDGKNIITVQARYNGATKLVLNAVDFASVSVASEEGAACSGHYDGQFLTVTWAEPFLEGEVRKVGVTYSVENPISGLTLRLDEVVTDHETERCRYWLPCVDHPSVRTPLTFHLTFPGSFTYLLANGSLLSESANADGTKSAHWNLDFPCPSYLICIAAGDYVKADGGEFRGREIAAFGVRRHHTVENLARTFDKTKSMWEWITAKLDTDCPWPKYYQYVMKAVGVGSAMENISLVSWDDYCVQDERLAPEFGHRIDGTNLHEMAHTYFGDVIVMEDFAHATIKESFANFMTVQWFNDVNGHDWYCLKQCQERDNYHREADSAYLRPIVSRTYNSSWQLFDGHLYNGGCVRLHTLKFIMGEDVFWPALQAYVREFSKKTVDIHDFRRVMERFHHESLQRFFEQFWFSKGYPNVKATYAFDTALNLCVVRVEQTQANAAKGVHLFDVPLEVAIETAEGQWEYHTVALTSAHAATVVAVPLEKPPLQVVFDPYMKSPVVKVTFTAGDDVLRRTLAHGPTAITRMDAARALGRSGTHPNVVALEQAFMKEPFWGVRVYIAEALADAGTIYAAEAAARLIHVEKDPIAIHYQFGAYLRFRLPCVIKSFADWLSKGSDHPYQAKGIALTALGQTHSDEYIDVLAKGLVDDSFFGWVRRGAATGLGEAKTPAAKKLLVDRLASGKEEEPYVRQGICLAIADCLAWAKPEDKQDAADVLVRIIKTDPEWRVRRSAGQGLSGLGLKEHVEALRVLQRRSSNQDHVLVERLIQKLLKSGSGPTANPEVDKLTDNVSKLLARVDELEAKLGAKQ